jgi:hypothetical protein
LAGVSLSVFIIPIINQRSRLDSNIFMGIFNVMGNRGRPPKAPKERRTEDMKIPLTAAEKLQIQSAADSDDAKPVTWAREALLRAAKRRIK